MLQLKSYKTNFLSLAEPTPFFKFYFVVITNWLSCIYIITYKIIFVKYFCKIFLKFSQKYCTNSPKLFCAKPMSICQSAGKTKHNCPSHSRLTFYMKKSALTAYRPENGKLIILINFKQDKPCGQHQLNSDRYQTSGPV